jgi:hypothetical protein
MLKWVVDKPTHGQTVWKSDSAISAFKEVAMRSLLRRRVTLYQSIRGSDFLFAFNHLVVLAPVHRGLSLVLYLSGRLSSY